MGDVRFSCPEDLIAALAAAGGIDAAVETGTFKAEGTLALRRALSRVWTIELSEAHHERAVSRHGRKEGISFFLGSSDEVLPRLADVIQEPVIFWLDAHGGMVDVAWEEVFDPAGEASQCPLMAELEAIRKFDHAASSCILIDDARAFLGPLPHHRAGDWPSLLQIIDVLRADSDRYITVLDDVIIAVPSELRDAVDEWWLEQIRERRGRHGLEQKIWEAYNPSPSVAFRRLVKSIIPPSVRRFYEARR